jgi:hypothetical protein
VSKIFPVGANVLEEKAVFAAPDLADNSGCAHDESAPLTERKLIYEQ